MVEETRFKTPDWQDVTWLSENELHEVMDTTGVKDVSHIIQQIIELVDEDSVLYFPKGNYYFEKGITINKRMTLQGESYYGNVNAHAQPIGRTNFITRGASNMSIITLLQDAQCIRNINFFADSCEMMTCDTPITTPCYKRELNVRYENVAAITVTSTKSYSHYEYLYAYGFSGTAISLGAYATARNITVDNCGKGMIIGVDSMLSNSIMKNCKSGLEIAKGVCLTNIRIEKMQEHGLITTGQGYHQIMNIHIRECGYSATKFDSFTYSKFTGILQHCCQFYAGMTYEEYSNLPDRKEEAYALFYGNEIKDACIDFVGDNLHEGSKQEKFFVIKAEKTERVILSSNVEADAFVQDAKGSLSLENTMNTYKYVDGKLCSNGYVQLRDADTQDPIIYHPLGTTIRNQNKNVPVPLLNKDIVIASTLDDVAIITKNQTGTWEKIGEKIVGEVPIYYYKKLEN